MTSESIYALAAKSAAVSTHLSASIQPLDAHKIEYYDLSQLPFDVEPYRNASYLFLRDNVLAFRHGCSIMVLKLGNNGLVERSIKLELGHEEGFDPALAIACGCQLSKNEGSLLVGVLFHGRERHLVVWEIGIEDEGFGEVVELFATQIPFRNVNAITIRDPYLCISGSSSAFVIDWRLGTAAELDIITPDVLADEDAYLRHPVSDAYQTFSLHDG